MFSNSAIWFAKVVVIIIITISSLSLLNQFFYFFILFILFILMLFFFFFLYVYVHFFRILFVCLSCLISFYIYVHTDLSLRSLRILCAWFLLQMPSSGLCGGPSGYCNGNQSIHIWHGQIKMTIFAMEFFM